ncbi:SDR family NAD(P)-dependent oxidoreductase [Alteraurantiacibacter aestuarii]|uniref:oxidoreductase n=1 Tax=Alteraurantiacibacter aestuarii TaxID=650004 RepID=UPI0031D7CEBC
MTGFTSAEVPDQAGRRFLITGANSGIGFHAARMLAGKGAHVLLGCRDTGRGEAAGKAILADHPAAQIGVVQVDLADLSSIRKAASAIDAVDVLINNAGIMMPPLGRTVDGFERQLGINHLGHFALTGLLLPRLAQGRDPRVVSVASIAHRRGRIDFDNLDGARGYSSMRFYAQSKLANLLFMAELDRRLRGARSPLAAIACHPGISGTGLGRDSAMLGLLFRMASMMFNTAEQGAFPTLQAACDPAAQSGDYFGPQGFREMRGNSGRAAISANAKDQHAARRLWDVSVELTGVDPELLPVPAP